MPPVPTVNDTLRTVYSCSIFFALLAVYRRTFPSFSKSRRRKPAIVTGLPVSAAIGIGIGGENGPRTHVRTRYCGFNRYKTRRRVENSKRPTVLREFRFIGFGRTLGNYEQTRRTVQRVFARAKIALPTIRTEFRRARRPDRTEPTDYRSILNVPIRIIRQQRPYPECTAESPARFHRIRFLSFPKKTARPQQV